MISKHEIQTRSRRLAVWLLAGLLLSGPGFSQNLDYQPTDQRGRSDLRRFSNMDGNRLRASIFNSGISGHPNEWPESIAFEYPKNTDRIYISIVGIWLGGEVTDENGDTIHIVDIPMWRESPAGDSWTMEPVAGFLNPYGSDIARSDDEDSGPPISEGGWRDKQDDVIDPGWVGSWNGFFGKNIFNADVEMFYRTGDDSYDRYAYRPDSTDATRAGLGLLMDVRTMAWTQILINDVVFFVHDILNDGTKRIPKASFLIFLSDWVGGDGTDDEPFVDIQTDVAFLTDSDRRGTEPFGSDPVGVASVKYLETPGNQVDGIDNDGDADLAAHFSILHGISGDPELLVPTFAEQDFQRRYLTPGDTLVLIDEASFDRFVITYPVGGGQVTSMGRQYELPAAGLWVEEDTLANALDDDLDGLIDERLTLHLTRFDEISGTVKPVRYINYLAFAPGDTVKRGFIVAGRGAAWTYQNVAPMIDESRDDGFDNDGDWSAIQNDYGMDGVRDTGDPGEYDGVPTSGSGSGFPGETNVDKTDVTETDVIGLTAASQIQVGLLSFSAPDETLWETFMTPGVFDLPRPTGEYDTYVSSGYFPLDPGQRQRMAISVAISDGGINLNADLASVIKKQRHAQEAYEVDYQFAQAPLKPTLRAVPGDGKVTLYWDAVAEESIDRYIESIGGQSHDFEGYKVYRSTDSPMEDARVITDAYGTKTLMRPIAQFDLTDGIYGLHPVNINGVLYDLGDDSGLEHSFVDSPLVNGQRYFYAVTAYDFGFEMAEISPSESPIQIDVDQQGNIRTGRNVAVVRPTAAAAGVLLPEVEYFQHVTGSATGYAGVSRILDAERVRDGHEYLITFRDTVVTGTTGDTLTTRDFTLRNITTDSVLIADNLQFHAGDEVPIVEGFQLSFENDQIVQLNRELSGWQNPDVYPYAFSPVTFIGITGERRPNDYRIIVDAPGSHASYDTSLGFIALPSKPVNLRLINIGTGEPIAFAYADLYEGDGQFNIDSNNDENTDILFLLEDDGSGHLSYTWQISLLLRPNGRNPAEGDTLEIWLNKPFLQTDSYRFKLKGAQLSPDLARSELAHIRVVPNPYIAAEVWEPSNPYSSGRGPREIHFINLPNTCTIRIFNVAGTLVDVLEHESSLSDGTAIWDVLSQESLSIAYGLYIYHIDAPGIGTHTGTFAIIK